MKAVLISTDYVKDTNGEFKVLEMNTQTGVVFKDVNNYLELDSLEQLVSDNGITTIEIITPKRQSPVALDLESTNPEPVFNYFENSIKEKFEAIDVTVNIHFTLSDSVTIPFIEDNDTTLVIRVSYDSTALIDSTYCADNFEFLKLMYDTDSTSIPATYINNTEFGFDTIGTSIRDNGIYPNYLIKERFPTTNYEVNPKILKISNIEDLNSIKSSLPLNTLLQEYVFNPSDVLEGKLQTYRVLSLVYGSNLDILDISHPFVHTNACAFGETVDFDDNGELAKWERPCYIQKHRPKTDSKFRYQFDDESKILMPDGSISNVENIQSGSILKTLSFVGMPLDETHSSSMNWSSSFAELNNNLEVTTTTVAEYSSTNKTAWLVNLELSNGSTFVDVEYGKLLSKADADTEYRFRRFQDLNVNDYVILFNNQTNIIEEVNVLDIKYSYESLNIYSVDVEPIDVILTSEEGVETPTYAIYQHNPPPSCKTVCCSSGYPVYTLPQCITSGGGGWCYNSWPATYDACIEGAYGTPYNCYDCISACITGCGGAKA
jgi:hypothetical protein